MAFQLGQGRRDNTLDVARLAHIGLDCDDVCLRREFARVIANLAQLIAVSGDKRKSTRAFARKSQRHFAPESLRCPGDENVFAR